MLEWMYIAKNSKHDVEICKIEAQVNVQERIKKIEQWARVVAIQPNEEQVEE